MPADPLQHVSPGTPLMEAVTAEVLNALKDAARDVRGNKLPGPSGGVWSKDLFPSLTVLIRNDTGGDLASGSILKITGKVGDVVNAPIPFRKRPILTGDVPDDPSNAIAILHEPILTGGFGRAAIAGVCVCYVSINDAGHEYASPITGDETALESVAFGGPARIVWKESSGAVRVAIVVLSDGGSIAVAEEDGSPSVEASTIKFPNGSLTDNGDGSVSVELADATRAGMVSTVLQEFLGPKVFIGGDLAEPALSSNNDFASVAFRAYNTGISVGADRTAEFDHEILVIDDNNLSPDDYGLFVHNSYSVDADASIGLSDSAGYGVRMRFAKGGMGGGILGSVHFEDLFVPTSANISCAAVTCTSLNASGNVYADANNLGTGIFRIGLLAGVTGTSGGGDGVTGGIITTLGSGPSGIDGGTF